LLLDFSSPEDESDEELLSEPLVVRFLAYAALIMPVAAMFEQTRQNVNIITKMDIVVLFNLDVPMNRHYISILS
jgi:hypothetical protein